MTAAAQIVVAKAGYAAALAAAARQAGVSLEEAAGQNSYLAGGRCRSVATYLAVTVFNVPRRRLAEVRGVDLRYVRRICNEIEDRRESGAFDRRIGALEAALSGASRAHLRFGPPLEVVPAGVSPAPAKKKLRDAGSLVAARAAYELAFAACSAACGASLGRAADAPPRAAAASCRSLAAYLAIHHFGVPARQLAEARGLDRRGLRRRCAAITVRRAADAAFDARISALEAMLGGAR